MISATHNRHAGGTRQRRTLLSLQADGSDVWLSFVADPADSQTGENLKTQQQPLAPNASDTRWDRLLLKSVATPEDAMLAHRKSDEDYREYLCGWGAAFVNVSVTFPISKVIFRQMHHGVETHLAVRQLRGEGLRFLYRGVLPPLIQKTVTVSVMFGTYAQYKHFLDLYVKRLTSPVTKTAIAAFLAGSTEAVLTPLERVQMLLQARQYHYRYNNTFHAFGQLKSYGLNEYYRGLTAILCRNGPSNILFFTLRGRFKSLFPSTPYHGVWWFELVEDFVSGSCVGALTSTIFYPVNVIRTKMQTRPVGSRFISIGEAFQEVYAERGRSIRKLFYGVHVNYSRAFVAWGIINASYEFFRKLLYSPEELRSSDKRFGQFDSMQRSFENTQLRREINNKDKE